MKKIGQAVPNSVLRSQRTLHYWTQSQVAEQVGTTTANVYRWESGLTTPSLYFRQKLCDLFSKSAAELGLLSESERQEQGDVPGEEQYNLKDLFPSSHLGRIGIMDRSTDISSHTPFDTSAPSLPIQPTPLIGREREVDTVGHLLRSQEIRLLTLTGPGGTGKTRLAVQVASSLRPLFADGVVFVSLAPISDPILVLPTIAHALGIRRGGGPSWLERLAENLQYKQVLLLLDNFEQVVSAALQVADLLASCPRLKVLVTSRQVLHLRAEQVFMVPPLALPDLARLPEFTALTQCEAVALFIQRARAVRPEFQVTPSNASVIAEICVHLDGLPLAIELAAARLNLLSPQALLARLSPRLQVLTRGARDVPVRQQTLRDTIAWSYHLLTAQEQQLFRRLCVFVGGFTLPMVEVVCTTLGDCTTLPLLDDMASLIDKSLLQSTEQGEQEPRLMMLETIREYGLELLAACGELEITRRAHTMSYLALAEEAAPELRGPQQVLWLERLEREHDNLRAAMHWLLEQGKDGTELALRLGEALQRFWEVRSYYREGQLFLERVLASSEAIDAARRAKTISAAGDFALYQYDHERAEALCTESLQMYRELGDRRGMASSLVVLGHVAQRQGNPATARSLVEESLRLFREVNDQVGISCSLFTFAVLLLAQGEYARAHTLFEENLALLRQQGNKKGIAAVLCYQAETLFVSLGEQASVCTLLEESLALNREVGIKDGMASCYWLLGEVALQREEPVRAHSLAEESLVLFREMGDRHGMTNALSLLGKVAAVQGDSATAHARYQESLVIARTADDTRAIASCLEGLAEVVAAQKQPTRATRLWGAAEALREAIGAPLPPIMRASYDCSVAAARLSLGERAFAAAWIQGRTMSLDQALAAPGRSSIDRSIAVTSPAFDGLISRWSLA